MTKALIQIENPLNYQKKIKIILTTSKKFYNLAFFKNNINLTNNITLNNLNQRIKYSTQQKTAQPSL